VSTVARPFVSAALAVGLLIPALPGVADAQTTPPPSDAIVIVAEPDFGLVALPTTLRMPVGKFAFRMSHRFARPIAGTCPDTGPAPDGCGGLGAFLENFFGFDSASKVGLELRYGLRPGSQVTVLRTNDRAIQFSGLQQLLRQSDTRPVSVTLIGAVEGQNNLREHHTFTVGAIVARQAADRGALYVHPLVLFNTNPLPATGADATHTVMVGVGGRLRLGDSRVYVVAEAAPRLTGFAPGVDHVSLAIERRSRGHVFQLNVSNSFASTLRQLAHGGPGQGDWFIGFNLARRFF